MRGYKEPGFQDRVAAASREKSKALDKLRSKPAVGEDELARRAAAQSAKEAAANAKRVEARRVREEAQAAVREKARAEAEAKLAAQAPVLTDEERKAARDARYAARKARRS